MYINDLQRICIGKQNVKFVLYADDTNIFIAFDKLANTSSIAQTVLSEVNNYMVSNLLHINLDKSCFMNFPKSYKDMQIKTSKTEICNPEPNETAILHKTGLKLFIGSTSIKEVTEIRFLGVTFDTKLNWNAHITQVQKKLKIAFATIKRISEYIPFTNHKSIYHTLFESHLSYCVSVWGGAKKKSIYKIFTLQKRAIRFLFGDYDSFIDKFCTSARTRPFGHQFLGKSFYCKEHTKPIFTKHNLLTMGNLYKYTALNEIGKIIQNQTPTALYESIALSKRRNENMIILGSKIIPHNQSFYTSCSNWNNLIRKLDIPNPHNIVPCILKYKLKRYLLQTQSDGDTEIWNADNY